MNETAESWSAPWHRLQRRLAAGVGAHSGSQTPRLEKLGLAGAYFTPSASWLAEARSRLAPTRSLNAK